MVNGRAMPYIIAISLIASFLISYLGYSGYQTHVEFEKFMSDAEDFQRSVLEQATFRGASSEGTGREDFIAYKNELSKRDHLNGAKAVFHSEDIVIQLVETPDGKIHKVFVPLGFEYQEGDAVSRSELEPYPVENTVIINEVQYDMPDEYFTLTPYNRVIHDKKVLHAQALGISVEEVDKKIANGEIKISLSEKEKKLIDEREAKRAELPNVPRTSQPVLDRPPVKVQYLPGQGKIRGWTDKVRGLFRKIFRKSAPAAESVSDKTLDKVELSKSDNNSSSLQGDDFPELHNSSPPFDSEQYPRSNIVDDTPKTSAPPTTRSIETQYREMLSPDSFDKAQQLIDQYGTEEGLRRLREMDPEAARRFELERRNPPSRDTSDDAASTQ